MLHDRQRFANDIRTKYLNLKLNGKNKDDIYGSGHN